MHTSYIQQSYPSFLSNVYNQHYLVDSTTTSQIPNTNDIDDDNQSLNGIPLKKTSRKVPDEEKDKTYYEKRARNNDSAKRSRDTRRIKEQEIQERVTYLEHENSRILMENQAIRFKISELHSLYNRISKPLQ